MEKRGREAEETELQLQEHIVLAVLLAAGAAVLMACFKRLVLVMVFLTEQWRAWVFLVLNLVLLAIVFTSISSTSKPENPKFSNKNAEGNKRIEWKKKREFCRCASVQTVEEVNEIDEEICKRTTSGRNGDEWLEFEDKTDEVAPLSKEALNERVEAFIAMFRQHLVSDARN